MKPAATINTVMAKDGLSRNTRIGDKYQLKQIVHQSELSIVYRARQTDTGETKLIKEFFPRMMAKRGEDKATVIIRSTYFEQCEVLRNAFEREASVLKELDHPSIVAFTDYIEWNGTAYIVTEYCKGITLDQYIKQSKDAPSQAEVASIMGAVVDALTHVHEQGFIHRDVKPANIMFDAAGGTKLIDFGSAIRYGSTEKQSILTSNGYSPLEFYSESSRQSPSSDIYSLAATIYYAFAGKAPTDVKQRLFEDKVEALRTQNRQISFLLSRLIHWGLTMSPEKRCSSLRWFEAGLRWERLKGSMRRS
ncbi:MAG: serine/threonine protein kinase [Candidatus Pristimantibacillus sp.]